MLSSSAVPYANRNFIVHILLLALSLLMSTASHAQERGARGDDAAFAADDGAFVPAPQHRLYYTNATFFRYNAIGLRNVFRIGWRYRLSDKDTVLLKDTYTFIAADTAVSPAFFRGGLYAEAQALQLLRVFGSVHGIKYFGTFDQILTWDDPAAVYSDNTIDTLADQATAPSGYVLNFGTTLRAAAGPIAIRSTVNFTRFDLGFEQEGLFFYEQTWDRLAQDGAWMVLNDADVLYVKDKLRAGVRYTVSDNIDDRGDSTDGSMSHHRVGPLLAWQFKDLQPGPAYNQPTLFVLTQWWLKHPYRTGQEQPAGLPLIAVGFAFNGDFKTSGLPSAPVGLP